MALNSDGKILALRGHLLHDAGAYLPWGMVVPHICGATVPGPYVMPAYCMDVDVVFTNKVPVTPVRGAGRPQAKAARSLRLRSSLQPSKTRWRLSVYTLIRCRLHRIGCLCRSMRRASKTPERCPQGKHPEIFQSATGVVLNHRR